MASQVYEHLMERILDMELEPFRELSEARLAAEFGISRTPVREALARLARRGLVDILPQRGTRVSPLSVDRIAKSRFIREALERPLARLAAEKMTPEISALLTARDRPAADLRRARRRPEVLEFRRSVSCPDRQGGRVRNRSGTMSGKQSSTWTGCAGSRC